MADERYEWLDHEAAERLLRGEPVDVDDDYTQWQIERLSETLDRARDAAAPLAQAPSGALPGEEAALAAFRAARPACEAMPRGSDPGPVRRGAAPRPPRRGRTRGWMRPAHWGLAASAAGLAVGGVSVAAGTGVLPTFGAHEAPRPAVAASVPAGPEATDGPAATPRGSTGPGRASGPGSPPPLTPPAPPTGTAGTATARGAAPGGGAPTGGTRTDDRYGAAGQAPDGTWPARTTQDCRDFRDGRIDAARRQQLELVAKASGGVRRFCDQVLSDGRRSEEPSADTGAVGGAPGADAGAGTGDRVVGGGDADPDPGDDGGGGTAGKGKPAGPKPPVKGGGKAR